MRFHKVSENILYSRQYKSSIFLPLCVFLPLCFFKLKFSFFLFVLFLNVFARQSFIWVYIYAMLMIAIIWFAFAHLVWIVLAFFYLHIWRVVFKTVKSIDLHLGIFRKWKHYHVEKFCFKLFSLVWYPINWNWQLCSLYVWLKNKQWSLEKKKKNKGRKILFSMNIHSSGQRMIFFQTRMFLKSFPWDGSSLKHKDWIELGKRMLAQGMRSPESEKDQIKRHLKFVSENSGNEMLI